MLITNKSRYATLAMFDLALLAELNPMNIADIAQRHGISVSYLEQMFAKLRGHNLVISIRGPGGGYRLARKPGDITLAEVLHLFDREESGEKHGSKAEPADTHLMWDLLDEKMHGFLKTLTLADLTPATKLGKKSHSPSQARDLVSIV